MPIIQTSAKHTMLLQTPPESRYKVKLTKCVEKKNNAGDGTNLVYEFEISDGEFKGKPLTVYCGMGSDYGIATMLQIHQAITGDTNPVFDTDNDIGGECVAELVHELYRGTKQARLTVFLPLKNPITGEETLTNCPF